jgi:sarcosine oxidase subunit beta
MDDWKSKAEIIIIGGGILGTSIAYHLSKRGQKGIILLEKEYLCEGSTGLSVGGFRQQFSTPANILLSKETLQQFKNFQEQFGVDIDLHQVGYLFLSIRQESWQELKKGVKIQHEYSVPVEILSPEEILHRWPYLKTDDLIGGTFCAEDGYADPYMVTMAFARAARKNGVLIQEKTRVLGIQIENSQVQGVVTSRGKVSTACVVNVAGPWGAEVSRLAGIELPVKPFRRQVFAIFCPDEVPVPVPMIINADKRHYFRGESKGILSGMSDLNELSSFNLQTDMEFMERVTEQLIYRAPVMSGSKMIRGWAGLYAITPDENPIIGKIDRFDGFYCAVGFSGHGFQHGPSVGRILSDLILDGNVSFDLSPFHFRRFEKEIQSGESRAV